MPMVVMAFSGAGSSSSPLSPRRVVAAARIMKEVYAYLWNGPARPIRSRSGWRMSESGSRRSWPAMIRRSRQGRSTR